MIKMIRKIIFFVALLCVVSRGAPAWFVSPMLTSGQAGGGGPATASLSASPSSIASGASSTLTWGSTGAASCTSPGSLGNAAIPGFTGGASGSASTGTLTASATYSIQCGTATASAAVTVTGGGGTVACDYGPNTPLPTGTAGTDLAAAGFSHCVLNADFTDNSGATVSSGWVMNNPNTWLNQCAGTSIWGRFWFMWSNNIAATNGDAGGNAPCNRVSFATDGTQVLSFQFTNPGDYATPNKTGLGLWWPSCGDSCSALAPALPNNVYIETTYRLSAGISQASSSIIHSLDSYSLFDNDPNVGTAGYIDYVTLEALANNSSATAWAVDNYTNGGGCGGKCGIGLEGSPDLGNFHTVATLTTTDNTIQAFCEYMDNAGHTTSNHFDGWDGTYCTHVQGFVANEMNPHNRRFFISIGPGVSGNTNTIVIHIQNVRIFECNNYIGRNNNCPGTVVWH